MRINGNGSGNAGPLGPAQPGSPQGAAGTAADAAVERVLQVERAPVNALSRAKERAVAEKNEYTSLTGLMNDLAGAATAMRLPSGFNKLSVESSHPDILDGVVSGAAKPGTWELEIEGLAQSDRHLDAGFPDPDKTAVGFGWMGIELGDKTIDVDVDPGSTLRDVADRINATESGVTAMIVNTGAKDDPFRLLVSSQETGEAARISIDTDTTFLDFGNVKTGRDLAAKFEDVAVSRTNNKLHDLIDGVKLDAKRAEPGTKVTVNIANDVDATTANIREFTEKYNQIAGFLNQQYQVDPSTGRAGSLSGDGNLRSMMRTLQAQIAAPASASGAAVGSPSAAKVRSLAEVGITTDPKTGQLNLDEAKLKGALAADYDGVAALFTSTDEGPGVAARLSDAIRRFQDPTNGPLKLRAQGLDRQIREQDRQIERQTERLAEREAAVRRQMSALNQRLAVMEGQGQYVSARLGGAQGSGQGGSGGSGGGMT
jgi:flagellar hook-associated protein 2